METAGKKRRCPICDRITQEALCPVHSMATLLVDPPEPSVHKLEVGSVIAGRYVIQRVIGKGGYGAVFEALHTGTGQGVAVKTLAPGMETDETALRRFFQEARVTSSLRHPNTIRVFDFGQDDHGIIYLAMELLTGATLKQELKNRQREDRTFSEREAIEIGVAITKSLGEAHAAGLVHRDLKPDNVFLHQIDDDNPVVKVLDFGIVKLANSSLTLGSDSGIPGTPAFMSPEQVVKRGEIDGRSDLYSLGILLYNLVTGTVPYRGADVMQTLYMHIHDPIPDVRANAKTPISDPFAQLIAEAMSKDPDHRPRDAKEMRRRLVACAGDALASMSSAISDVVRPRSPPEVESGDPTLSTTPSMPSHRSLQTVSPFSQEVAIQAPAPVRPKAPAILWGLLALITMLVGLLGTLLVMRYSAPVEVVEVPPIVEHAVEPPVVEAPPEPPVEEPAPAVVEEEEAPPEKEKSAPKKAKKKPSNKKSNDAHEVLDEKI